MEHDGVEHLDAVYRAIRLAAGTRIAHNNPSAERLATLMSDVAVKTQRKRGARRQADRRTDRAVRRCHAAAHDVVLGRRWRRQCRVHHPESRREVRLRRGGAGIRRVPQQLPVLGRGRYARAERAASGREAGAADGAEHRHAQRAAGAGARHAGQLRHLPDAAAGAGPAYRFRSRHPGGDRGAARAAMGRHGACRWNCASLPTPSPRFANAATRPKRRRRGRRRSAACRVSRSIRRPA